MISGTKGEEMDRVYQIFSEENEKHSRIFDMASPHVIAPKSDQKLSTWPSEAAADNGTAIKVIR